MKIIAAGQNLSDTWRSAVQAGKIVNLFETLQKQRIEFGLTIQNGDIVYYAKNVTTGAPMAAAVEERVIDGTAFRVQYNGYRALRPGGNPASSGRQPTIPGEAERCRFYCQDPQQPLSILRRDPLAEVALKHHRWNAYASVTPFEKEGHFLWIPAVVDGARMTLPHFPQEFSREMLEDTLSLFRSSESMLFFFNSLHAGATVNHIHLQSVFHGARLAIEDAPTFPSKKSGCCLLRHDGAEGLVFERDENAGILFSALDRLQSDRLPFNLIL